MRLNDASHVYHVYAYSILWSCITILFLHGWVYCQDCMADSGMSFVLLLFECMYIYTLLF